MCWQICNKNTTILTHQDRLYYNWSTQKKVATIILYLLGTDTYYLSKLLLIAVYQPIFCCNNIRHFVMKIKIKSE